MPSGALAKPPIERRLWPRTVIGVPIAVRASSCPWAEETMTLDLSADGLSFITPRVYNPGDTVKVAMLPGVTPAGWGSPGEISAHVVRVAPIAISSVVLSAASSAGVPSESSDQLVALRRIQ